MRCVFSITSACYDLKYNDVAHRDVMRLDHQTDKLNWNLELLTSVTQGEIAKQLPIRYRGDRVISFYLAKF